MNPPPVQYAVTGDGVSIAYYAVGEGQTVLVFGTPTTHLLAEWPRMEAVVEAAARVFRYVRFDPRGFGMSQRDVTDFGLDAMVSDIEAVMSRVGAEDAMFVAGTLHSPVAIAYAARNLGRVSRMAITSGSARGTDLMNPQLLGLARLGLDDWELGSESIAGHLRGWEDADEARFEANLIREAIEPANLLAYAEEVSNWDVTHLLDDLAMPVLLIPGTRFAELDVQRRMASQLQDGRVSNVTTGDPAEQVFASITAFISEGLPSRRPARSQFVDSTMHTVLFTDLVGHTEMMSRLGDEKGREVLREHERITREVLAAHGGTEVKTMGDGFMASFGSVTRAVECAVALQRKFEVRGEKLEGEALAVRCGLNAGEPIEEDGDLFGATVILASRIAAKADGGEILVSDTVRGLCSGKGFLFSDRGEFVAKGFDEAVRVYEVRWGEGVVKG
jgi:class 3 adenylate cyclase